jgi:DNA-binding transcriptional ArsR family regulator
VVAIGLSAGAVARIRFAVSALWEVAASVRVLRRPDRHAVHLPWVSRVRPELADAGLIETDDCLLWHLIASEPDYLPDFLTPTPTGLNADLTAELSTLRATPADVVRSQLRLLPAPRQEGLCALYDDPASGLERLAEEIREYWRIALAPDWARIRLLLDSEVAFRARRLAEKGAAGLLNDLHEQVTWADGTLSIALRYCTARDVTDGPGLVLVPSAFVWPSVLSIAAADWPQLAYPARGIATLWESAPHASESLVGVLGRTRAQLLVELRAPASTTELAHRTGITAGGVSQHLATLRAAGLVTTSRQGRALVNTRTPVADALLAAAT